MILSGYVSHSLLLTVLNYANGRVPDYLTGVLGYSATTTILVLSFLIALGGTTVILGGLAILARRITIGRTLIMLGGGAGLLGFLVSFGYSVYRIGLTSALAYLPYWIGVLLAVAGRRLARRA